MMKLFTGHPNKNKILSLFVLLVSCYHKNYVASLFYAKILPDVCRSFWRNISLNKNDTWAICVDTTHQQNKEIQFCSKLFSFTLNFVASWYKESDGKILLVQRSEIVVEFKWDRDRKTNLKNLFCKNRNAATSRERIKCTTMVTMERHYHPISILFARLSIVFVDTSGNRSWHNELELDGSWSRRCLDLTNGFCQYMGRISLPDCEWLLLVYVIVNFT